MTFQMTDFVISPHWVNRKRGFLSMLQLYRLDNQCRIRHHRRSYTADSLAGYRAATDCR
jgi:hypothetical protein